MKIIGLTGGIGSGKSTVAQMFQNLGILVYNSDFEAKELMNTSHKLRKAIIALLGSEAYKEGKINRAFIANKVFKNTETLHALNAIVHPAVKTHFEQWVQQQSAPYVIQETALLFENQMQDRYDLTILVTAPVEVRLQRVMARDKITAQDVRNRMKHQMKEETKKQLADFCIPNNDLQTTRMHVASLHRKLTDAMD